MTAPNNLRRTVMRRVRIIRTVRPFMSSAALSAYLLVLSLHAIGREVFVAQVWRNIPSADPVTLLRFAEAAFLNTTFLVQGLSILSAAAMTWLARECIRTLAAQHARFA
jgi:hypothetical protein